MTGHRADYRADHPADAAPASNLYPDGAAGTGASLRRLGAADLAAYKVLRDQSLLAYPSAFTSDAETERAKPAEAYRPRIGSPPLEDGRFTIGAWPAPPADEADGVARLVGAISCERDGRRQVAHIGHIVGMMVLPHAQRRGIGRALLDACVAAAQRADGVELLTLSVTADNLAAVALYRRAGFTCYGTLPRAIRLGGTYHAKDLMVLDLRQAAAAGLPSRAG